jgi:predicted anti-sigma-YlaC factor YlaD
MIEHHHHHGLTCKEMLASLSDYIDAQLNESLCLEIEEHLRHCENCQLVLDSTRKTIEIYQHEAAAQDDLPGGVRQRLLARLHLGDLLQDK